MRAPDRSSRVSRRAWTNAFAFATVSSERKVGRGLGSRSTPKFSGT